MPTDISIPVPQAYKDYLVARKKHFEPKVAGGYIPIVGVYLYLWWSGGRSQALVHLLIMGSAFLLSTVGYLAIWQAKIKKPWCYELTSKGINLVWWQHGERVWTWHQIQWTQDVICSVTADEWRGFPALCIAVKIKFTKKLQKLYLVYAHEDEEQVRTQVLPLIEHYRQQYRHDFWANQQS